MRNVYMFVDIVDCIGVIGVENILMPYKKGRLSPDKKSRLPKEKITPDVCLKILQSTNYKRNIKDMLHCIAELPTSEQTQFKDVVLACFNQREQPEDILVLGKKLAAAHGFEQELDDAIRHNRCGWLASSAERVWTLITYDDNINGRDFSEYDSLVCLSEHTIYFGFSSEVYDEDKKILLPPVIEAPNCSGLMLSSFCDLSNVRKISLKKGSKLEMSSVPVWPEVWDVSLCDRVEIPRDKINLVQKWKYQPGALCFTEVNRSYNGRVDFSQFGEVTLTYAHFEPNAELVLRDGANFTFQEYAKSRNEFQKRMARLPDEVDVSACREVCIETFDLSYVKNLRFRNGAKVRLLNVQVLPDNLDFSCCDVLHLSGCNLKNQPNLRFADGAKVRLNKATNLPPNLDFSCCDEVDLRECDLINQPNLRFKTGATVRLSGATNLPPNLDFSCCDVVDLSNCDLSNQPNLRFKKGAKVYLNGATNLPPNLDFSQCDVVNLSQCDLKNQPNLRFADGARVSLAKVNNMPKGLDFSKCRFADLSHNDLEVLSCLKFGNDATVDLSNSVNLPRDIDFSNCKKVTLFECDMALQSQLRFKKGAEVDLTKAKRLNGRLDFSSCAKVRLNECDLGEATWLGFSDGAKVEMKNVRHLPPHIDFSPCAELLLECVDLNAQDVLCFAPYSKISLFRVDNMPEFVDVSLCQSFHCKEVSWEYVQEMFLRDVEQARLDTDLFTDKNWCDKTVFINVLDEKKRKSLDLKRQKKLQLIHQCSEEQRLIKPKRISSYDVNENPLAKLWGRILGKDRA